LKFHIGTTVLKGCWRVESKIQTEKTGTSSKAGSAWQIDSQNINHIDHPKRKYKKYGCHKRCDRFSGQRAG